MSYYTLCHLTAQFFKSMVIQDDGSKMMEATNLRMLLLSIFHSWGQILAFHNDAETDGETFWRNSSACRCPWSYLPVLALCLDFSPPDLFWNMRRQAIPRQLV